VTDPGAPSADDLRGDLVRFARKVLALEAEGRLLDSPADLQTVLGELRRRLFAWEVRRASEIREAREAAEGAADTSSRVVREAREADEALRRTLDDPGEDDPGPEEES
jgi:hypothetical protein